MTRLSGFNTRVSMEDADTPIVLGTPLEVEDLIEDQMATEEFNGLVAEMQNDLNALDEAHAATDTLQETQAAIAEKLEAPEAVTAEDVAIAQEALKLTAASLGIDLNSFNISTVSYESSKSHPSEALQVSMESIGDFMDSLAIKISELFNKVINWIKKMIVKASLLFNNQSKKAESLLEIIKDKVSDSNAKFDENIEKRISEKLAAIAISNGFKIASNSGDKLVAFIDESAKNKQSLEAMVLTNKILDKIVPAYKETLSVWEKYGYMNNMDATSDIGVKLMTEIDKDYTALEAHVPPLSKALGTFIARNIKTDIHGIGSKHMIPITLVGPEFKVLFYASSDSIDEHNLDFKAAETFFKAIRDLSKKRIISVKLSDLSTLGQITVAPLDHASLVMILNHIKNNGNKTIKNLLSETEKQIDNTKKEIDKIHTEIKNMDMYNSDYYHKSSPDRFDSGEVMAGKYASFYKNAVSYAKNISVSVAFDTILGAIGAHKAVLYYCAQSAKLLK